MGVGDWRLGVFFDVGLVGCGLVGVASVAVPVNGPPSNDAAGVSIVLSRISFDEAGESWYAFPRGSYVLDGLVSGLVCV